MSKTCSRKTGQKSILNYKIHCNEISNRVHSYSSITHGYIMMSNNNVKEGEIYILVYIYFYRLCLLKIVIKKNNLRDNLI